jgi:serine protease Do
MASRLFNRSTTILLLAGVLLLPVTATATAASLVNGLPDFTQLVEQASPAVVNISTTQRSSGVSRMMPKGWEMPDLPEGNPLNDLFRHFFDENGPMAPEHGARSLGSGFIISEDGLVLTNHHVIEDAEEIIVRLSDRRELKASVIGSDPRSDIALLRIDSDNLPVVNIGGSEKLKRGQWVLAIGSPFGFDHSVTAGIVSATGRSLPNENYIPFIQTDVAINPGNSGGPLFDMEGRVVGINSQIYSRTGGYMGLSFAIPIEMAMEVVAQLKESGHVRRGWLGVLIQDVTRDLAESFGMERPHGALVSRVLPDSPAAEAGFEVGDIIVSFDGQSVDRSGSLPPIVGRSAVGGEVPVEVIRNRGRLTLRVTLGELPDDEVLAGHTGHGGEGTSQLGMELANPTAELREEFKLGEERGVVVRKVGEGPAARAGIRPGDLIQRINHVEVEDVDHLAKLVRELPAGKAVPVLIVRDGGPHFIALKVE